MENNKDRYFALVAIVNHHLSEKHNKNESWKIVKDFKITMKNIAKYRKIMIFRNGEKKHPIAAFKFGLPVEIKKIHEMSETQTHSEYIQMMKENERKVISFLSEKEVLETKTNGLLGKYFF